jgi:hypothetical protein
VSRNRASDGKEFGAVPLLQPAQYAVTSISFPEHGHSQSRADFVFQWSAIVVFHPFQWLVCFNRCTVMIRVHLPCKCTAFSHAKYFNLELHKTIYLQLAELQILYSMTFLLCLEVVNSVVILLSLRQHPLGHTKPAVQLVPAAEDGD